MRHTCMEHKRYSTNISSFPPQKDTQTCKSQLYIFNHENETQNALKIPHASQERSL